MIKSVFLSVFLITTQNLFSSETDQASFRDIKLKDSSKTLNSVINKDLEYVRHHTNFKLSQLKHKPTLSDAEHIFMKSYFEIHLSGSLLNSTYETCINSNFCWPGEDRIERIITNHDDNIYLESDYNEIAGGHSAATINLCDVRLGGDKITHMFLDGFLYYNCSMSSDSPWTDSEIIEGSHAIEDSLMGLHLTGVHSNADVEANLQGVKLYRGLFFGDSPYYIFKDGRIHVNKDVDLCRYVNPKFDEVINPNSYLRKPRVSGDRQQRRISKLRLRIWERKMNKLKDTIERKLAEAEYRDKCWSDEQKRQLKNKVLNRRHKYVPIDKIDELTFAVVGALDYLLSSDIRKGYEPYINNCIESKKRLKKPE